MIDNTSHIELIHEEKTFHRLLELDMSPAKLQELLKKALVLDSMQLFRTRRARDLLTSLTKKIKSFATTVYGKLLVNTLLPTQDVKEIKRRQQLCQRATNLSIPYGEFSQLLLRATTLRYTSEKKHNGTCIAFLDEELYLAYRSQLSKKFYVTLIENEQDFISIDHYEHIRYVATKSSHLTKTAQVMSQVTIIDKDDLLDIAPEFITDILETYADAFASLKELHTSLNFSISLPPHELSLQRQSFHSVQEVMQQSFVSFQSVLSSAISSANFSGVQLMTIVNKQQSILDYLDEATSTSLQDEKNALQKKLEVLTGVSCVELFSITSLGELHVDERKLKEIEKEYLAGQEDSLYVKKVTMAHAWSQSITQLPQIIEELYQYELLIALREFIQTYDLNVPSLATKGISFLYGKNMNIAGATPVEYHIGIDEQVAIITGANSGGKTTLLELLGQIQILTHMGLYVPAKEAQVGLVDEIYYFSKNKGSLSAGAFETLLKQFSGISDNDSKKLILADEIESVTEPDVAAKIIKGIISHLRNSPYNSLVIVTHMGRELEALEVQGRFDGIEAKGLDADLNLVVDRNPVIGRIARSTPQLIIERLSQLEKSPFYDELRKLVA